MEIDMKSEDSLKNEGSSKIIAFKPRLRKPHFEAKGNNNIEYEEILKAPKWLQVSIYSLFAFVIGFFLLHPFITHGESNLMYLILSLVLAACAWIIHLFLTLKTTLTSKGMKFGFYSFSKYIAYDEIAECSVMRYNVMDFIGWGIRKGRDGITMYNILGDQQIAVKVIVREQDGSRKTYAFSAKRPQVISQKIQSHIVQESKKLKVPLKKEGKIVSSR